MIRLQTMRQQYANHLVQGLLIADSTHFYTRRQRKKQATGTVVAVLCLI
jgi:hypothetical protein